MRGQEHRAVDLDGDAAQRVDELAGLWTEVFIAGEEIVQAVEHDDLRPKVAGVFQDLAVEVCFLPRGKLALEIHHYRVEADAVDEM